MTLYYVVLAELPEKGKVEHSFGVYLIKSPHARGAHDTAKQHLRNEYKIPVQHHILTRTLYSHPEEDMAREYWRRFEEELDRAQS